MNEDFDPIQEPGKNNSPKEGTSSSQSNGGNYAQNMNNYAQNNNANTTRKTNSLGLISFVLSLIGLFIFGLPCGIAAIITGVMGLVKFNPETDSNKWMAIVGLVIGAADAIIVAVSMVLKIAML